MHFRKNLSLYICHRYKKMIKMRVQKITLLNFLLVLTLLFISTEMVAQAPTVSATSPTNATYRTTMTITGTNFVTGGGTTGTTSVGFYVSGNSGTTIAPLSYTFNSATQLTVVVPSLATSGSAAGTYYLVVSKTVGTTTTTSAPVAFTYTPPAQTPVGSVVERIITSYNGYWSSGTNTTVTSAPAVAVNPVQPDTQHSLYAFRYGGTLYSTGDDAVITNTLANNAASVGAYTPGNWRAIPINNIAGTVPASASVYLVLGSLIDGSASTSVHTAPSVVGLSARDVLIDGTRGLGLGTGLTNLPSTSPLTFAAGSILENKAGDNIPDIMVTQIAEPTTSEYTTYCFVDASGNIVGNPVEIKMNGISKLGTYKTDFFTLQTQAFNTAIVNGVGSPGNPTRDIRILAYKLSDFGITNANRSLVTQFKVLTNGSDDMAFIAYNRDTFTIPAPEIVNQPTSMAVCPGGSANFSVSITSTGYGTEVPTYQWEKNGIALVNGNATGGSVISGANTANLVISNVSSADYGIYRCVVSNTVGAAFSNSAYLNSIFLSTTVSAATCQNSATTLEASAEGNTPQYQWYLTANGGATNSTTGGTAISGATSSTYSPPVTTAGTKYYYVQAYPQNTSCAAITSGNTIPVTVYATSNAGTISANQTKCSGTTATVSVSGYTGAIQWQSSANNSTWSDISGANASSYTSAALTVTTYYRAFVTNGNCGGVPSSSTTITVNPVSSAGTASANQSICTNNSTSVSISNYTGTIQWQSSTTSTTTGFTNIDGATTATYTTPVLTATTYYRAVVTSGVCSVSTSSAITVTVSPTSVAGSVTPDQLICYNSSTAITLSGYTGSIQWQQSVNGTTGWANINSATSATYNTPALTEGTYYRALVSSGGCSTSTSGTVHITVNISYIWVGTTSVNWNTASNWSCNLIPTSAIDVTIPAAPANQPTVNNDGTAHAKTLVVEAGAHLTIATGGTIQVVNAVTVTAPGTFVVENNGALIQDNQTTNTGVVTVKRNSNSLYRLDYTLWSSPVADVKLRDFSTGTSNNRFYDYRYDTTGNGAAYNEAYWPVDPLTTYFTAGKGILIRMPNSNGNVPGYAEGTGASVFNGEFTGTPYNGDVQVPLSIQGNKYTAVGNPYASPISIKSFFLQNADVLKAGSPIYVWRKKNNYQVSSYATITLACMVANTAIWETTNLATPEYTSGGQTQAGYFTGNSDNWLLSQGQGFLVKTNDTATTSPMLTFTNSMRKPVPQTGGQSFFKSAATEASRLWLNMENATSFSQLAVAYIDGQTLDIDYGYDGLNLGGDAISIYTLAGENNLTIQSRPAFETTDVVPVGYTAGAAGSHTISIGHVDGVFASGQKIYIKDKVEGITRDLTLYDYTFTTEAGTVNDRFEIIYTTAATPALGTDTPVLDPNTVVIFKENNTLKINTGDTVMNSVKIFDIRGRVIYSQDKINNNEATVSNLAIQQEVIIVEVTTEKGIVSKKVIF
jgi:Immunoglobulin domain